MKSIITLKLTRDQFDIILTSLQMSRESWEDHAKDPDQEASDLALQTIENITQQVADN